ncbi:MAG: flagellar protein FlgN [Candidatus Dactylopiibacterium sp.]|nr:flagellar protein FlgN [Candidatus Dactylopiibacterium sp.]
MSQATDIAQARQRLLALILTESQQLREFVALLERERAILGERDVEPLFALSEQKGRQARVLQHSADARTVLLSQLNLRNDRAGIETVLAGTGQEAWEAYLALALQARTLNQANGQILTERLSHNHQALAVLLAHSDQPATYGPDGSARARPGSRLLGSY